MYCGCLFIWKSTHPQEWRLGLEKVDTLLCLYGKYNPTAA